MMIGRYGREIEYKVLSEILNKDLFAESGKSAINFRALDSTNTRYTEGRRSNEQCRVHSLHR